MRAILKGMAATRDNTHGVKLICDDERHVTDMLTTTIASIHPEPETTKSTAPDVLNITDSEGPDVVRKSSLPLQSGGTVPIQYLAGNVKDVYRDK